MSQQNNSGNYSLIEVLDKSTSMCEHIETYSKNKSMTVNDPSKADNFRRRAISFGKLSIDLAHAYNHTTALNEIFQYLINNEMPVEKPVTFSDNAWLLYNSIVNPKTITMYENNMALFYCDLSTQKLTGE